MGYRTSNGTLNSRLHDYHVTLNLTEVDMDTFIGLLADIADVFLDLLINKIIGRFKKKDKTDI